MTRLRSMGIQYRRRVFTEDFGELALPHHCCSVLAFHGTCLLRSPLAGHGFVRKALSCDSWRLIIYCAPLAIRLADRVPAAEYILPLPIFSSLTWTSIFRYAGLGLSHKHPLRQRRFAARKKRRVGNALRFQLALAPGAEFFVLLRGFHFHLNAVLQITDAATTRENSTRRCRQSARHIRS